VEDLFQEGALALLRATERYDPRCGARLTTYSFPWIRHAMARALRRQRGLVRLPPSAPVVVTVPRGRPGSAAGTHPERGAEESESDWLERFPDPRWLAPFREVELDEARCRVRQALGVLQAREAEVLRAHYGIDRERAISLAEIGERLSISRERVYQIERHALTTLRVSPSLADYRSFGLPARLD
jgi:RNA polymerase sigma factor (sigma-70 family)